jgi:hypothetical protein
LTAGAQKCGQCGTSRPAIEPSFARAEEAYVCLRQQYDSGSLSADQFEAALQSQWVDYGGQFWMIGVNSGTWYVHEGKNWHEAEPPLAARLTQNDQPASGGSTSAAAGQSNSQQKAPATPLQQKSQGVSEWVIMSIAFAIAALGFLYLAHNR